MNETYMDVLASEVLDGDILVGSGFVVEYGYTKNDDRIYLVGRYPLSATQTRIFSPTHTLTVRRAA
jgi:hypothetical protein